MLACTHDSDQLYIFGPHATDAFKECFDFVRDSGTIVEVGNFVDSGKSY